MITIEPAVEAGELIGRAWELGTAEPTSVQTGPIPTTFAVMAAVERQTARMLPVTRG